MGYFKNKSIELNELPTHWREQAQRIDYQQMEDEMRERRHQARQELQLAIEELKLVLDIRHFSITTIKTAIGRIKKVYEQLWQNELW